jgi:DNA-binding NarL/FixJ family response regulator
MPERYLPPVDAANPAPAPLTLLLADDHEVMRLALRHALQPLATTIRWIEAADAAQVDARLADGVDIDLALVDLNMPGMEGLATVARWRRSFPTLPLVILSATDDVALVRELIGLGIAGFVPKSDAAAVMLQAIRLILAGGTYAPLRFLSESGGARSDAPAPPNGLGLTPRQVEVLGLLARGLPNKGIARELGLSEATVKVHLLAIFRVLQARNRTEAVVAAQRRLGSIEPA